jgi:MFS transporter, DHA1 family, tetracycline resistance protein
VTSRFKNPLAVIFLTVFIDLLGFGILIPLMPTYAQSYGASGTEVGLLAASFSFMQLVFAPVWGRLSDRVGRRPVLMLTALGTSAAYVVFGLADSLWLLFVARAFAGACGGSIATAQAYIADVTTPENRGRGMAIIGAGFGLGFTLGPALAVLADSLGPRAPFFVAAGLALINTVWIAIALPEPARHEGATRRGIGSYADALRIPTLLFFIGLFLLTTYAFSNIESSFALLTNHELGFTERDNGLAFTYIGLTITFMQLVVVRRLARKVRPVAMMMAGTACMAVGAAAMPLAQVWWHLAVPLTLLSAGNALYSPSMMGAISTSAPVDRQGEMLGVAQSFGAVGRIAGPAGGGVLFDYVGHAAPFYAAGVLMLLAFGLFATRYGAGRQTSAP